MNAYLYSAHITSCLMAVYNSIERDRTSACEGASGCRYQSSLALIDGMFMVFTNKNRDFKAFQISIVELC